MGSANFSTNNPNMDHVRTAWAKLRAPLCEVCAAWSVGRRCLWTAEVFASLLGIPAPPIVHVPHIVTPERFCGDQGEQCATVTSLGNATMVASFELGPSPGRDEESRGEPGEPAPEGRLPAASKVGCSVNGEQPVRTSTFELQHVSSSRDLPRFQPRGMSGEVSRRLKGYGTRTDRPAEWDGGLSVVAPATADGTRPKPGVARVEASTHNGPGVGNTCWSSRGRRTAGLSSPS